jgi:hypothetical protein
MSIVNNSLKLTINALALSFRERLTKVKKNHILRVNQKLKTLCVLACS